MIGPAASRGLVALALEQSASDPILERLDTVAWSQLTMAIVMVVLAVVVIAAGIALLLMARRGAREVAEFRRDLIDRLDRLVHGADAGPARTTTARPLRGEEPEHPRPMAGPSGTETTEEDGDA